MSRLNRSDANQSVAAGEEEGRDVREGGGRNVYCAYYGVTIVRWLGLAWEN